MFVEIDHLLRGHRERRLRVIVKRSVGINLGQVQGGKRSIEMKIKALLTPSLTVVQAGELFGISKDEFNLKARFVIAINGDGI